ncbi:hypothetical protein Efla_004025 [Eimeria flavescens]
MAAGVGPGPQAVVLLGLRGEARRSRAAGASAAALSPAALVKPECAAWVYRARQREILAASLLRETDVDRGPSQTELQQTGKLGFLACVALLVWGGGLLAAVAGAPSHAVSLRFETTSAPLELPVCPCVGLQEQQMAPDSCALESSSRGPPPDLCFMPPSLCAVVESADSLPAAVYEKHPAAASEAAADSALQAWTQAADWQRIQQQVARLELLLPAAETPKCRCWPVGPAMVAPCGQHELQEEKEASVSASPFKGPFDHAQLLLPLDGDSSRLVAEEATRATHRQNAALSAAHADELSATSLGAAAVSPCGQQQQEAASRRLAGIDGSKGDGRPHAARGGKQTAGSACHPSCATCAGPGRDQCLSCSQQLEYPYRPPASGSLAAAAAAEDGQHYALVAAHRDGRGFCVPLAFGKETGAAAEGSCVATSSSCSRKETASPADRCHATCAVCRADCCSGKPDNCLACKGTRRTFHPIYRDGTGRCLDVTHPEEEEEAASSGWGWLEQTAPDEAEEVTSASSREDSSAFTNFLQSLIHATSFAEAGGGREGRQTDANSAKGIGERSSLSFLPRRSICKALPQRVRDLPIRAWSQLMFIHADNNLEESALLDLDEMLHPWRGEVVRRNARAASHGRGTPPLPIGGSSLLGPGAHEALEDLYLVVLIDRSHQATSTDMGTVHACPELEYSRLGQGARVVPGSSEVELDTQMAFELLRIHLQDGRREWLLLRALGEVDMNDPLVLQTTVTRFLDMFPSRHYAVTLWNHGSAWAGFGDDESNPNSQPMSLQDIAAGLTNGIYGSKLGKVDRSFRLSLLGFDACLMGSYDVLEALAPLTHFFLASEENEPGHGWNYRQAGSPQTPWRFITFFICSFRSMDPTTLNRKPPPLYRTATAFEYGTRFVTSYGLHPPSSNALTLALIEVRTFNEFKQKFEELLESLYSCGGSNITRRVRRALSQTFSVRGCRMLGLCSCYDLSDFLANLLQQFASDENEFGKISLQSHEAEDGERPPPFKVGTRLLSAAAKPQTLQQFTQQRPPISALGAATRALTDKVVAARVLFRKMVVSEVGSREPGRYGGLSIYFPDPHMAVNCKTQRSASGWARRYTSTIRTKFSSFVSSVLANRKGSVCYAPWGAPGGTAGQLPSLPQPGVEKPQWFDVLCSRILKPFSHRRPGGAVGLAAIVPLNVASALMFKGIAMAYGSRRDEAEILVTSTSQATMTDAELKGSEGSFDSSSSPSDKQQTPSSAPASVSEAENGAEAAAALREFTVVQGWCDSRVWTLKQLVRLEDPLKDPRPSAHSANAIGGAAAEVETILVALQEGQASSRGDSARTTSISFPFLFFKDAVEAECLDSSLLHMEALSRPRALGRVTSSDAISDGLGPPLSSAPSPVIQPRHMQAGGMPEEDTEGRNQAARHILSTTVLPLGFSAEAFEAGLWGEAEFGEEAMSSSTKAADSVEEPLAGVRPPEMQPRSLGASPLGTASWLLHERLGREPQRDGGAERPCGARAYLLAEWNEQQNSVSDPVLFVVENEQATEWPRTKGGLLRPIEHRLRRKMLSKQELQDLLESSKRGGSSFAFKGRRSFPTAEEKGGRPLYEGASHRARFPDLSSQSSFFVREATAGRRATSHQNLFKGPRGPREFLRSVAATVLEESLGQATFFWNIESDASRLILKPKSVSRILEQRRLSGAATTGAGRGRHIERPVIGIIAQDIFDQRAVVANSVPQSHEAEPNSSHGIWASVGQALGFFGPLTEGAVPSSTSPPLTKCPSYWLGDGICDEPCDTSEYEFDKGDCPHRNRFAEDLLEQQEPKGACVENRCSETALCEAYEDLQDRGGGPQTIKSSEFSPREKGGEAGDAPLVATIWEGPRGRYICRCPKGYTGDGVTCDDINECELFAESICHNKAICINTKGSYRCLCKVGV